MSGSAQSLRAEVITFLGLVGLSLAGILPVFGPVETGPFISDTGPAAIWPVILGMILFLIISLPIIEYTRLVPFAGGYYGLAELGFGNAAGKFTGLMNTMYGFFWLASNAFAMGWTLVDGIYYITGYLLPIWVWILIGIIVLVVEYFIAYLRADLLSRIITYSILIGSLIVVAFAIYVIVKSPYNSLYYLNPMSSSSGFGGIALATATVGFYLFVGYGTSLFFSEEAKTPRLTVYKAIYASVPLAALIIAIIAYSQVVAVPLSKLSQVSSSALPFVPAWSVYMPLPAILAVDLVIFISSTIAMAGDIGYVARLLWSLARDNFIRVNWLKKLDPKHQTPKNASLFFVIMGIVVYLIIASVMVIIYGYNPNTISTAWVVDATIGTIIWYFHHFIPEVGLFGAIRRFKIPYPRWKLWLVGLIVPILGLAFFLYTFYEGVISDLVEPYFGALITAAVVIIGAMLYVIYKWRRGELGESFVSERVMREFGLKK